AIRALGIQIKNYMSTLSPDEAERVRAAFGAPARPSSAVRASAPSQGPASPPADTRAPQTVIRRRADVVRRRREEEEAAEVEAAASELARAPAPPPTARPIVAPPAVHRREPTPARESLGGPAMTPRPPQTSPSPSAERPRPVEARPQPSAPGPGPSQAPGTGGSGSAARPGLMGTKPPAAAASPSPAQATAETEAPKKAPGVGDRIELPPNTRRFAGGMASRLDPRAAAAAEPRAATPAANAPSPASASPRPAAPAVREAGPQAGASSAAATPATAATPAVRPPSPAQSSGPRSAAEVLANPGSATSTADAGGRRVLRNEEGVIVGAASQRSEPKILGFIPLAQSRKKQQVIITDVSEEGKQGRATQRKQREERLQAQQRRRKMTRKPMGKGGMPGGRSTVEMSDEKKRIRIDEVIQVSDLAHQMGQKASVVLRTLWGMGLRGLTINHAIDMDTAELVASEFGYTVENVSFQEAGMLTDAAAGEQITRAPIITIMGHVDHGKTSLLDKIREARVAAGEAGGITQHIGAYRVETKRGSVVFLDTPGHEAFTQMRARGAQVTDIVVLVVAADDGVMPTTIEAIKHAQEAEVPIVVAVNKIDKGDANPGRVKQSLMEFGIVGEEFGGETPIVEVSAKTGQGIDKLLEQILLQSEVLELAASAEGRANGVVLEARVDKGRGPVATVLVTSGTLRVGDMLVAAESSGKVRGLYDDRGQRLEEAPPSTPVEVLGLDTVPAAGDLVNVVESDRDAKALVGHRREQRKRKESVRTGPTIQELLQRKKTPVLKIVLRADVQGSAQAVKQALEDLSTAKVKVEVIKSEVGQINETDVKYARAGDAVIFGFNVKTTGKAAPTAESEGVEIETFEIIYEATQKAQELMLALLEPEYREREQGEAEVRALFPIPRLGVVAGCRVTRGIIQRTSHVRVVRQGKVLHSGTIGSLRVFKDDVKQVTEGFECGIVVEGFPGVSEGDTIQAFEVEAIPPTL
ncbi:MAG TPA: translation initiation factor IF-2, partial [Nannocystaceae bacterium]|nr:translation initiation factor IF-2 [Nannocystaceae bacterium]